MARRVHRVAGDLLADLFEPVDKAMDVRVGRVAADHFTRHRARHSAGAGRGRGRKWATAGTRLRPWRPRTWIAIVSATGVDGMTVGHEPAGGDVLRPTRRVAAGAAGPRDGAEAFPGRTGGCRTARAAITPGAPTTRTIPMTDFRFQQPFEVFTESLRTSPAAANTTFRASSRQVEGLHSQVRIRDFTLEVDEPPSLAGSDRGPNPVELALASLATCREITYRLYADALGIRIDRVSVSLEGDLDLRILQRRSRRPARLHRDPRHRRDRQHRIARGDRPAQGDSRSLLPGPGSAEQSDTGQPRARPSTPRVG